MSLPDQVPFTDDQGGPNYRRASKACIPCREKKVKCHLGPLDRPGQPPCIKCRRSGRFCYFDDKTRGGQRKKARKDSNANTNAPSNLEPAASSLGPEVTQGEIHSIPNPVLIERESTMLNENDPLALSELRNSGDTFNMLAAAASKTSPVRNASIAVISPSLSSLSDQITKDTKMVWGKCIFVQNKFLTRSEAIELVTFYYIALADIGPFANTEYVDPNKYDKLVNEDILLLGAILTVASRLHPIPGIDGWSRSKLIHKRMWKWTKNEISSVVFGGRNLDKVGLGIVEACLLLSEWAPRDVLEGEDDHDSDQSTTMSEDEGNGEDGPRRDLKVVLEGAYRTDRFSWYFSQFPSKRLSDFKDHDWNGTYSFATFYQSDFLEPRRRPAATE